MFNRSWIISLLFIPATIFAIPDLSLEVHHFRTTESSFAEVSIYIVGSSLVCTPGVSEFYGVEYTILIQNDNGQIATGNRYKLTNTGCTDKDLIDVKRFALMPGNYSVDVEMTDLHDKLNTITVSQKIVIEAAPVLSDVQLLSVIKSEPAGSSALHKSGMYLEPLPFRYYYPSLDKLSIYFETYETEKLEGQPYVQYTLKPLEGDIPSPLVTHRKVLKQSISPNIFQLDISSLISGPYSLEATLFDGNKKMITSKTIT